MAAYGQHEVPEAMNPDAAASWPSKEPIGSFFADFDFEFRPGEDSPIHGDAATMAAARKFRDVLGRFASGVTVVTSLSAGEPVGMTCQSFSSVSLEPPLVLFVPAKTSHAWPLIQRSGTFCVNLLGFEQAELSNRMATRGIDKFDSVPWRPSEVTGSPLLEGVLGWIDCTVHTVHQAGDHYVVIGAVQGLGSTDAKEPLLFFEGEYVRPE